MAPGAPCRFRPGLRPSLGPRPAETGPEAGRGVRPEDQGVSPGPPDHDRAGRPLAGLRQGPDPPQVPRPDRRYPGGADLRQRHPPLLRRHRQGDTAGEDVDHRQVGRGARHVRHGHRRRGDHQGPREVQGRPRPAHRPAQDERGEGQGAHRHRQADLLDHLRHALDGNGRAGDAAGTGLPPRRRGNPVRAADPQQHHRLHHAGDRGRRAREAGRHLLLQQEARHGIAAPAAHVLGQVCRARQQPRQHRPVPEHLEARQHLFPRVAPADHARPARGAVVPLCQHRHRAVQRGPRPDHDLRVVDPRPDGSDGDDQARRPGGLHLRLLRRLGPELHVLCRARAQRHRPLLRSPVLRSRHHDGAPRRHIHEQGVVPPQPAAAEHQVGPPEQHQHPAIGDPDRLEPRRKEQGDVPRELLAQEQARRGQGLERADVRVGHSGRTTPQGRSGGRRECPPRAGPRVPHGDQCLQGGHLRCQAGGLHRARRPALPHHRRHVLLGAELPRRQPAPVRRHGVDVPALAQHPARGNHRQVGPRAGHDARHERREGGRRH